MRKSKGRKIHFFIILVLLIGVSLFLLKPKLTGNVISRNDTSGPAPTRIVLSEGYSQEITVQNQNFIVSVEYVDSKKTKIKIRDEEGNEFVTDTMYEGSSYKISDVNEGIILQVDVILAREVVGYTPQVFVSLWNKEAFLCTDTDGGLKYDKKGKLLIKGGRKTLADFCWYPFSFVNRFIPIQRTDLSSDTLFEYYCDENGVAAEKIECLCEDGRCIAEEEK